jgi:hypothetical protein
MFGTIAGELTDFAAKEIIEDISKGAAGGRAGVLVSVEIKGGDVVFAVAIANSSCAFCASL